MGVTWQPRSASALDHRSDDRDEPSERQSWMEFDDAQDVVSTLEDHDPSLDDNSSSELYRDRSHSTEGTDEDDVDNRYSMFTDGDHDETRSRVSIMDKDRSHDARQKFLKKVEEMYSKDGIASGMVPPVPKIPSPSSPRWKP